MRYIFTSFFSTSIVYHSTDLHMLRPNGSSINTVTQEIKWTFFTTTMLIL